MVCRRAGSALLCRAFGCCRAPGEGRGAATASLYFRLPEFGVRKDQKAGCQGSKLRAPDLRIEKPGRPAYCCGLGQVTSGLTRTAALLLTALFQFRPIPVGRNFSAWDCKVTPARCACQEGNTIGCIPSNDGLDAALVPGFPHARKQWICGDWLRVSGRSFLGQIMGRARREFDRKKGRSQQELGHGLLIGCAKVEILVNSCGKRCP